MILWCFTIVYANDSIGLFNSDCIIISLPHYENVILTILGFQVEECSLRGHIIQLKQHIWAYNPIETTLLRCCQSEQFNPECNNVATGWAMNKFLLHVICASQVNSGEQWISSCCLSFVLARWIVWFRDIHTWFFNKTSEVLNSTFLCKESKYIHFILFLLLYFVKATSGF